MELLGHNDYDPDRFNYGPCNRDLVRKTPPLIRSLSGNRVLPGSGNITRRFLGKELLYADG